MSLHMFAVKTEDNKEARYYLEQSSKRAYGPGLHETFAEWLIFEHEHDEINDTRTYIVGVKSMFPDAWKFGGFMIAIPFLLVGLSWTWWMTPGLAILGLSFLASGTFRYWVFRMGLRRYGYEGEIKKLDIEEVIASILRRRRDEWHKAI